MSFPKSHTTWLSEGEMEGEINAKSIVELSSTVETEEWHIYIFFIYQIFHQLLSSIYILFLSPSGKSLLSSKFSSRCHLIFHLTVSVLSLSLLSCLLALQHTLVASLSLSNRFYISLFSCLSLSVILPFSVPLPQVFVFWMLCTHKH